MYSLFLYLFIYLSVLMSACLENEAHKNKHAVIISLVYFSFLML